MEDNSGGTQVTSLLKEWRFVWAFGRLRARQSPPTAPGPAERCSPAPEPNLFLFFPKFLWKKGRDWKRMKKKRLEERK